MKWKQTNTKALLAVLLNVSIIGFSYAFVKIGLKHSAPLDLLADRLLIAFISIFLLRAFGVIKVDKISKLQKFKLLGLSLLYPTGFFAFQIWGIQVIPVTETAIIYATLPIFTLLASSVLLKEKTTWMQKAGCLLSVLGILWITLQAQQDVSMNYWGYFFIFCSLFSIVMYYITLKKMVQEMAVFTITFYLLLYAMLMINVANLFMHIEGGNLGDYLQRFQHMDYLAVLLYLGVLSTLGTSFLTNFGLKHLPTSVVGIFNNLSPIIGVVAGVVFLKEALGYHHILGGVIVLIGLLMSLPRKKT